MFEAPDGSRFSPAEPPSQNDIEAAERALGFALPIPLVELYFKYGNGGFGPGYGVIGVEGGHSYADSKLDLVGVYQEQVAWHVGEDNVPWPKGLLLLCHYGCGLYSCVMSLEEGCPVYLWTCDEFPELDVYPFEGHEIKLESESFEIWVSSWEEAQRPHL